MGSERISFFYSSFVGGVVNQRSFEFVDIGGGYGAFAKVMKKKYKINTTIIEPSPYLHSVCVNSNLKSINKFLEDVKISELPEKKKIFT